MIKKIPAEVIRKAKGLAIFTTMRTGLWFSGAGGSGILVGRKEDGSWSPPSGILLHTAGLGFLVGVDIYDCVVVINSQKALDAFSKLRCTLGGEISAVAGPVGAGALLESEVHKRQAPIFTYLKSRGFYAGVQIDGTIVIERTDENERFYGEKIGVGDILKGKVRHPPYEVRTLMETIKAAQGDTNIDESLLTTEPPPGDYAIEDGTLFGVPEKDDPDPYGVLALEKEGMEIREASTKKRASWEEFSFQPAPSSPIAAIYGRNSQDRDNRSIGSVSRRNSWRTSVQSQSNGHTNNPISPSTLRNSMEKPILMMDTSTQTDFADPPSPSRNSMRSFTSRRSSGHHSRSPMQEVPENDVLPHSPIESGSIAKTNGLSTPPHTPPPHAEEDHEADDAHIEEPVVHTIQRAQPASPQVISKARLVTVPKRIPPKLPPRNPNRKGPLVIDASPTESSDAGTGMSPTSEETAESRNDSHFHPSPVKERQDPVNIHVDPIKEDVETAQEKMDNVHLDEEEEEVRDPWAKVEETKRNSRRMSNESREMPGSFH